MVGPGHHLMLRRNERPVRLDRFPATVGRYKRFLSVVAREGSAQWDHPAMPAGYTHEPWRERLRVPSYYDDPAYDNHPAIAVNWWSAYALARFEGKRLPTSFEWEAAAPWTDHPLITYEAWRQEVGRGRLADALPCPARWLPCVLVQGCWPVLFSLGAEAGSTVAAISR